MPGPFDLLVTMGVNGPLLVMAGQFQAREDLVLRQVLFTGSGPQAVGLDPDFTRVPVANQASVESQLVQFDSTQRNTFTDLNFPLLKNQIIYWGVDGINGLTNESVQLIFSRQITEPLS